MFFLNINICISSGTVPFLFLKSNGQKNAVWKEGILQHAMRNEEKSQRVREDLLSSGEGCSS